MEITRNRLASLVVAAIYSVAAVSNGASLYLCAFVLAIPIGFIWTGDETADDTDTVDRELLSSTTSRVLLVVGWLLLIALTAWQCVRTIPT